MGSEGWRTIPCGVRGRIHPSLAAEGGSLSFADETPLSHVSAALVPSAVWGSHLWMCLWVLWVPQTCGSP